MNRTIVKVLAVALMSLATVGASAQFGNLGNRIKQNVKSKVQNKVYQATHNPGAVVDEVSSRSRSDKEAQSKVECSVGGKTYKINGRINHEGWNKSQNSKVTFTGIPASIDEFRQLQQTLGTEPQGAVALQVMAFEMYRRDRAMGEEALRLNNTSTNLNSTLYQLKEVYGKDDGYNRPYLAAALMDGAKNTNAYTPNYPYCVKVRVNPVTKYQESQLLQGTVLYLQIDSEGWDTNWRGVEVVRPEGEPYFVVSNCPAMYTQCKQIKGTWQGLK